MTVNTANENRIFPLHVAAQTGNAAMTELLLTYSAKVGCMDNDGLTPLHYAAKAGHKDVLIALLKQNAQVSWAPFYLIYY